MTPEPVRTNRATFFIICKTLLSVVAKSRPDLEHIAQHFAHCARRLDTSIASTGRRIAAPLPPSVLTQARRRESGQHEVRLCQIDASLGFRREQGRRRNICWVVGRRPVRSVSGGEAPPSYQLNACVKRSIPDRRPWFCTYLCIIRTLGCPFVVLQTRHPF